MGNELLRTNDCISMVLDKYGDMVLRLCMIYLKNRADAEDAFQEIFIKLFQAAPDFNDEGHEKAWLITVTLNHCKNVLKSTWHSKVIPVEVIVKPILDNDKRDVIKHVLGLPVKYRSVIYLYYYEGYSTSELAVMLKEKEPTIRTRLKRGRELLKSKLTGGFSDEE